MASLFIKIRAKALMSALLFLACMNYCNEALAVTPRMAAGSDHSVALTKNGVLSAWGSDYYGQLGQGSYTSGKSVPSQIADLSGVVDVACGSNHTAVAKSDGTIWVWGWNYDRQLADATIQHSSSVPLKVPSLSGFVAVAAGYGHTLALNSAGEVWAWGLNSSGQLGDGTESTRSSPIKVDALNLTSGIKAIEAGRNHSVALTNDGYVYCWGENGYGQLGLGELPNQRVPKQIPGLSGVAAIAAGTYHTVALKTDGTVWAWGHNFFGQVGDGTKTVAPSPIQVPGFLGVAAIACGGSHTLALKTDGTVWAWGANGDGQLGNGTLLESTQPAQVAGLSGVVSVTGGSYYSFAVKNDGSVWAWGNNFANTLGDGSGIDKSFPVRIGLVADIPEVAGAVTDKVNGQPVEGVLVSVSGVPITKTYGDGTYGLNLASGTYSVTFSKNGYPIKSIGNLTVTEDAQTQLNVTLMEPAQTPIIGLAPGVYTTSQDVAISSPTPSAVIRYTIDGTSPSETTGTVYSAPVKISATVTLKAAAYKVGEFGLSQIASATYTMKVGQPTLTPPSGTYKTSASVSIASVTPDAQWRYTVDGTTPTATVGTLYKGPIYVGTGKTLKVIGFKAGYANSNMASASYSIVAQTAATPVVGPAGGLYTAEPTISITSATPGATIRYTTDGSIPTQSTGAVYTAPFTLYKSATIKAIAFVPGSFGLSGVGYTTYTLKVGQPIFTPPQGTYSNAQSVAIVSKTNGSTIRYTLDGSTPTATNGTVYTSPVTISATQTLKAAGFKTGYTDSNAISSTYTIVGATAATPTFSPVGGIYTNTQTITLTSATAGATIRYTTDYTTPTQTSGTIYTAPFKVLASTSVKAIAYKAATYGQSAVASATFTLKVAQPAFGPLSANFTVAVTTATQGAEIYYTLDASTPSPTNGAKVTGQIPVTSTVTITARGFKAGFADSNVMSKTYQIAQMPVFSLSPGNYMAGTPLSIATGSAGAQIKYTTDGSTPTVASGTVYTGPIELDASKTVKAIAHLAGVSTSPVAVGQYAIQQRKAPDYVDPLTGMEFVWVPAGSFNMGDELLAGQSISPWYYELPVHRVTLSRGYYIGKYEVTQAQWQAVTGFNNSLYSGDASRPYCGVVDDALTYLNIQDFIQSLNQATGKHYRLPTEAEWEYAARGGSNSQGNKYSGFTSDQDLARFAWTGGDGVNPVGRKLPNELDIFDMSGNVWEWTGDLYATYSFQDKIDPIGALEFWPAIPSPVLRPWLVRGGSGLSDALYARNSFRAPPGDDIFSQGGGSQPAGFRLVLVPGETVAANASVVAENLGEIALKNYFVDNIDPYYPQPGAVVPDFPFFGGDYNGNAISYTITNGELGADPYSLPQGYVYTTGQGAQSLSHIAYDYKVVGEATNLSDGGYGKTEGYLRLLETPLVQYWVFFNEDLSMHPGPAMNSWGRIHTNGNLYLANQDATYFRNYDPNGIFTPISLSVHGDIAVGSYLMQNGTLANRATQPFYLKVRNTDSIPAGLPSPNPSTADCENLNISITPVNKAAQEDRFNTGGVKRVSTGVDTIPTTSYKSLQRDGYTNVSGSGFYERESLSPQRANVDGMRISIEGGQLQILLTLNGQPTQDVSQQVHDYQVYPGVNVDIANWPQAVRTRADNTVATTVGTGATTDMIPGSIVYSVENPVTVMYRGSHVFNFPANVVRGNVPYIDITSPGPTYHPGPNPWYPSVLEVSDGREDRQVDFTVIDMQQLQYWYYDYVDYNDDNTYNNSVDTNARSLLIYATRTTAGTDIPVAGTGNNLRAIKLIGSNAGRTRGAGIIPGITLDRQRGSTFRVRTTFATPEPVYFEGDFNVPWAGNFPAVSTPGMGSAVVCDAPIFLSNNWGNTTATWNRSNNMVHAGASVYPATHTAYATALFSGRYNFRNNPTGGEEAGIHNFTRLIENWQPGIGGSQTLAFTGCLINLWFSERATAPHAYPNDYYGPPIRIFGWDVGFANPSYWPPYVPGYYSVERF